AARQTALISCTVTWALAVEAATPSSTPRPYQARRPRQLPGRSPRPQACSPRGVAPLPAEPPRHRRQTPNPTHLGHHPLVVAGTALIYSYIAIADVAQG